MASGLPNFVVIGAAKAGTSAIYAALRQHPDVFMSAVKEPNFFAMEGQSLAFTGPRDRDLGMGGFAVTDRAAYEALFAGRTTQRIVGEASPLYLAIEGTAERMARYVPDAKLLAVLRDPAERALSQYGMFVRDRREFSSFRTALRRCERRRRAGWEPGWQYVEQGFYARQLQRFYAAYPSDQIKVAFYDDFRADPRRFLADLCLFLGIDPALAPAAAPRVNESRIKRRGISRLLNPRALHYRIARALLPGPVRRSAGDALRRRLYQTLTLTPRDRRYLVGIYRDDILELQRMTGRDLSPWLA